VVASTDRRATRWTNPGDIGLILADVTSLHGRLHMSSRTTAARPAHRQGSSASRVMPFAARMSRQSRSGSTSRGGCGGPCRGGPARARRPAPAGPTGPTRPPASGHVRGRHEAAASRVEAASVMVRTRGIVHDGLGGGKTRESAS
jgi:hypothetical protein